MVPVLIARVAAAVAALALGIAPRAAADSPERWPAAATRCEALAERLHVAPPLRPIVGELCRRAPTFRRQVVRLADEPALEVTVAPGAFPPGGRMRARTAMTRVAGHLRTAVVELPRADALLLAELVAHEFEHIVEQLDGVDLGAWAGRSGVSRVGDSPTDGPFETERARQVGRLVAGEFMGADGALTARRVR